MKKLIIILIIFFFSLTLVQSVSAQCSICSKTVQQMGDKPGRGFNSGIIYLMVVPYVAISVLGYKWWKTNR